MFAYWSKIADAGGYSQTAKEFRRKRTTISRMAKKYNWIERLAAIQKKIVKAVDDQIAESEISNLQMIGKVKTAVAENVLEKAKNKTLDSGVRELVAITGLEEELRDKYPPTGKDLATTPEEIKEALDILKSLPAGSLARLWKDITTGRIEAPQLPEAAK